MPTIHPPWKDRPAIGSVRRQCAGFVGFKALPVELDFLVLHAAVRVHGHLHAGALVPFF
jgi:hypothetical protein